MKKSLKVEIAGVIFRNPVLTASGTFGMGEEYIDFVDYSELGGIILKTVTTRPRKGNPPPRIIETPCGLLNSIGLENPGYQAIVQKLSQHNPFPEYNTRVIFSIAGDTVEEYGLLAREFSGIEGIDMLELNLSCPNVKNGGRTFDVDSKTVDRIVREVVKNSLIPFTVKLSPNNNILENSRVAVNAGAHCLTISNTFIGMAIDRAKRAPLFKNIVAGYSGPAVKPLALYNVYRVAQAVNVPIIASGGISSIEDAQEFLMAGASLISVGTMNFIEPAIAGEIARGLAQLVLD